MTAMAAPGGHEPPVRSPRHTVPVLAAALSHLLARDEGQPALWTRPAFAASVDRARRDLAMIGGPGELAFDDPAGDQPLSFAAAAAALARDPGCVALAIGHLERHGGRSLPGWADLVRRGIPRPASAPDAALWFG